MSQRKSPVTLEKHGDKRVDNYFWLKERDAPRVLEFLRAENQRTEEALSNTKALQERLFAEMKGRIKANDSSAPVKRGAYHYFDRFEEGKEYPIFVRKMGSLEAKEERLLDINELAKGYEFFSLGSRALSSHQELLAYSYDTKGRRFYDIQIKDLKTGRLYGEPIRDTTGNIAWAADNKTLFFTKQHPETLRAFQVYRYELGANTSVLVYEEKDEAFHVGVYSSKKQEMVFISSSSTTSNEVRFIDGHRPKGPAQMVQVRQPKHEYSVQYGGDYLFILTNDQAPNFKVVKAPVKRPDKSQWQEVVAHRSEVLLEGIDVYRDFLVLDVRKNGLAQVELVPRSQGERLFIEFPDATYLAHAQSLPEYDEPFFRIGYESLVRPDTIFDYSVKEKKLILVKEREVPGFQAKDYETERLWATAKDGSKIPISLVYKKGFKKNSLAPLLLYGYGSYGFSMEPWFAQEELSLIDRGFTYAIAHIRGGSEMGRHWYDQGRMLNKSNTFTDFIACAEHLIEQKYTSPRHLYINGGSAGGLLMGAVMNIRPDLFNGVVADVPFVDVISTMLDESIPLTTSEYEEWGNPNDPKYYFYMKSYSPYDNVRPQGYPHLLVTTGYHDSQVQYWEPAKWVAKLREQTQSHNNILLFTEMSTGHSGATGRYNRLKTQALRYAFILTIEGLGR